MKFPNTFPIFQIMYTSPQRGVQTVIHVNQSTEDDTAK